MRPVTFDGLYGPMSIPEVGIFVGIADPTGGHFTAIQAGEVD